MEFNVLIWGGKSQSLILSQMIKKKEVYFLKKKIYHVKSSYIYDDKLKKLGFKSDIKFLNNKKDLIKILKKKSVNAFIVGVGGDNGKLRYEISKKLIKNELKPCSCISTNSYIDSSSELGVGVQIMPNSTIHCLTKIGDFSIINTSSSIDHECKIGKGVHIMPGASIAGRVKIRDFATIGTNATVLPDINIDTGAYVGAGAVVTKNVKKNEVVVGNPAKFFKKKRNI